MALITFMSDFGNSDHYVAAVKAKILNVNPGLRIIDISHNIEHFNIAHGAFVLKSIYNDFPKGTVHLVGVDSVNTKEDEYLAMKLNEHYFLGVNNGLFSLISDNEPAAIIRINLPANKKTTFPAKDVFAAAAARLASGASIYDLGNPTQNFKRMLPRQVKATKKQMVGNVIRVDHYGNLITNLEKELFLSLRGQNEFYITFGRERVHKILDSYSHAEPGDCFVIFNDLGLMEVGINNGNASELLGLYYDSNITVTFIQVEEVQDYFSITSATESVEREDENAIDSASDYSEPEMVLSPHDEEMDEEMDQAFEEQEMTISYRFEASESEEPESEEEIENENLNKNE